LKTKLYSKSFWLVEPSLLTQKTR